VTMGGSRKPGDYPSITVLKGLVTDSPQFHSRVVFGILKGLLQGVRNSIGVREGLSGVEFGISVVQVRIF
jgi:hypothetical protein